jgi:tRNA dimethylallyltransferase
MAFGLLSGQACYNWPHMSNSDTQSKPPIMAIVGPTGVGKTAYAVYLAKQISAEIISADSRQIYRGLDIATGKDVHLGQWQTLNQRPTLVIDDIPIHGLDLVNPDQPFSVADWTGLTHQLIAEISQRGHLPLLAGGSGFYLQGLTGQIATLAIPPDPQLRRDLAQLDLSQLQQRLHQLNPQRFQSLNPSDRQNPARLIRAIEVNQNAATAPQSDSTSYDVQMLGLKLPLSQLYARADARIEAMLKLGLVEETQKLVNQFGASSQAMTGIGYAEIVQYLQGTLPLDRAVQAIKYRTHAYIRRQQTWWQKQPVTWIDVSATNWQTQADALARQWIPASHPPAKD